MNSVDINYDNSFICDFSDCFGKIKKNATNFTVLENTKKYYEEQCVLALKNPKLRNFVEPCSEITCFTVDEVLSKDECQNLINKSESYGYKDLSGYRKDYRGNQRVVLKSDEVAKIIMNRVRNWLPNYITIIDNNGEHEIWDLDYINPLFRFGKYNSDDLFRAHKDSGFSPNERTKSMLTIMFYLSELEDETVGRTRMLTLNETCQRHEDVNCKVLDAVIPKPGRCIVFNQYSIYHDGESVGQCPNIKKYIMRTDIFYTLRT